MPHAIARITLYLIFFIVAPSTITPSFAEASPSHRILVMGDSLSAAYGIEERLGWVQLLRERLQSENKDVAVTNASVSGETSAGGKSRLPALIEQYQPTLVILELGANDGLRGYPIKTMRDNLATMIEYAQANSAEVMLIGMHIPPNYGKRYARLFSDSYPLLATQYDVLFAPFLLDQVGTNPELMQQDGLHPTVAAQPQLLNNVWPYLQRYFEE